MVNHPTILFEPGMVLMDEYEVQRKLGQGGMGTVFLVRHVSYRDVCFAVKTLNEAELENEEKKNLFLRELRTWIDLPEFPHLTACRFFRTIDGVIAIFAEYVSGGSLRQWIQHGRLLSLEKKLDAAIQFAWGLQAAHDCGVIHQDVKPANVLVSESGVLKVTDFGLSRAREVGGLSTSFNSSSKHLVSSSGMTLAYCSPEQAVGDKLDHRTDMWSWGVSVLEMFIGSVTWEIGLVAPLILETYIHSAAGAGLLSMPESLADLLTGCFAETPDDRWPNMETVAHRLQEIYQQQTGESFSRQAPTRIKKVAKSKRQYSRKTRKGTTWDDPLDYLTHAVSEAGQDVSEMVNQVAKRSGSRNAAALRDIELYASAGSIYSEMIGTGRDDLRPRLIRLLYNKALVHRATGDVPGAMKLYKKVESMAAALGDTAGLQEAEKILADAHMKLAYLLRAQGHRQDALDHADKAIRIFKTLMEVEKQSNVIESLVSAYMNKAVLLNETGDDDQALELYDAAIDLRKSMVAEEMYDADAELSVLYMNKANIYLQKGDTDKGLALYDISISIREKLVKIDTLGEMGNDLALVYINKAIILYQTGDRSGAMELLDKSINIREQLVFQEQRKEMESDLARAYSSKATALSMSEQHKSAGQYYEKAIAISERLVKQEGRSECSEQLGIGYLNKTNTLIHLDRMEMALEMCEKTLEVWTHLLHHKHQIDIRGYLGHTKAYKAEILLKTGDITGGRDEAHAALRILEEERERTGDPLLAEVLSRLKRIMSEHANPSET